MPTSCWAIDVGKSSLKAVKLAKDKREGSVELAELYFDDYGPREKDDHGVAARAALHRFVDEVNPKGSVVVSIPGQQAFSRFIKLPPVDQRKVAEMVGYEAQQQIPFDLDEVIWGWQKIERDYEPGEEVQVGLFAVRKDLVLGFLDELKEVGLVPDAITLTPLGLYNFFRYDKNLTEPTIILDIGSEHTDLLVIDDEQYWFRNLPVAGNDLTKAIESRRKVPFAKAEEAKIAVGSGKKVPDRQAILASMAPVLKDLVQEVHRSIGFYKSQAPSTEIKNIILCGNGCKIPDLDRWLSQQLKMDVKRLKRVSEIVQSPSFDTALLVRHLLACPVAFGLGIQGLEVGDNDLNLLPPELATQKQLEKQKVPIMIAVALLAVLVGFMYMTKNSRLSEIKATLNEAEELEDYKDLSRDIKKAEGIDKEQQILEEYQAISMDRTIWVDFFERFSQILPTENGKLPQIELKDLRKKNENLVRKMLDEKMDEVNKEKFWILDVSLQQVPKAEVLPSDGGAEEEKGGRGRDDEEARGPTVPGKAIRATIYCAMRYRGTKDKTITAMAELMEPRIMKAFGLEAADEIEQAVPEEIYALSVDARNREMVTIPNEILLQKYSWVYYEKPASPEE